MRRLFCIFCTCVYLTSWKKISLINNFLLNCFLKNKSVWRGARFSLLLLLSFLQVVLFHWFSFSRLWVRPREQAEIPEEKRWAGDWPQIMNLMGFLCLGDKVWTGKSFNGKHFFSNHGTLEEEPKQVKLSAASSCCRFFIHGKVEGFWKDSRGNSTDRITLFLREIEGTTQHRQTLRCRYSGGVVAQSGVQYRFPVKSYTLLTTWIPRSRGVFETTIKKG